MSDILFSVEKHLAFITLNRAKALNALNLPMINTLYEQLCRWQQDDSIHAVVIQAVEGKAFCAGGDIRWLYEHASRDASAVTPFFEHEYRLNQLIHDYPKPYIAIMDGITMGGGVGIALHGSHPVATERFVFAMPETAIGFFPDIGASYLLTRTKDHVGFYLGLTGQSIQANEALALGLVKHKISSAKVSDLIATLHQTDLREEPYARITACLSEFKEPMGASSLMQHHALIKTCFQKPTMPSIIEALQKREDPFAHETLMVLSQRSPLSLCVTLKQLQRACDLPLAACLDMDAILTTHFMQGRDFFEGVRAMIIDKDKSPRWQFADVRAVDDELVNSYFTGLRL